MALFYADSSALVKLVLVETGSSALQAFLDGAEVVSSEFVLTEVLRAARRAAATDPSIPRHSLLARAGDALESLALIPVSREVLLEAGSVGEGSLRALDAIHVATALGVGELDGFVSYDERQAACARLCGLRTVAPGS